MTTRFEWMISCYSDETELLVDEIPVRNEPSAFFRLFQLACPTELYGLEHAITDAVRPAIEKLAARPLPAAGVSCFLAAFAVDD